MASFKTVKPAVKIFLNIAKFLSEISDDKTIASEFSLNTPNNKSSYTGVVKIDL